MITQTHSLRQSNPFALIPAFLVTLCLFLCAALPLPAFAQPSKEALKEALRQVLKESPELVLDMLKENSETMLEIVREGHNLQERKAYRARWEEDLKHPKKIHLEGRAFQGAKDAPVTIVAYSDFTCSFCREAEQVMPQLLAQYSGKVRYTFKALPPEDAVATTLAKYATAAFMLDPEKAWKLHEEMFKNTEKFESGGEDYIKEVSTAIGFDYNKLKDEAASPKVEERLAADRNEAKSLRIEGTPHFLVNDLFIRGAVDPDTFAEAIEKALGAVAK